MVHGGHVVISVHSNVAELGTSKSSRFCAGSAYVESVSDSAQKADARRKAAFGQPVFGL